MQDIEVNVLLYTGYALGFHNTGRHSVSTKNMVGISNMIAKILNVKFELKTLNVAYVFMGFVNFLQPYHLTLIMK